MCTLKYLITGGAGFMGSNLVRYLLHRYSDAEVMVYDKLTYSGRLENLHDVLRDKRIVFVRGDVCNEEMFEGAIRSFQPDIVIHMAAETHVDRSINEPSPFLKTNVYGTFTVLEVIRRSNVQLMIHVSTDEVYGDLWGKEPASEDYRLTPSSPYSASKAAGDLLCQSYWRTYGVPVIIIRPSNNYGPYQHPEKLIPKTIIRALHGKPIPVYGRGDQVRDWLYVRDFCEAVDIIVRRGGVGEIYNIPGFNERKNIEVVRTILEIMGKPMSLIRFVSDRPGHDRRYSMLGDKILSLGWRPKTPWIEGLKKTINWFISNKWWWKPLLGDKYFIEDIPWRMSG